MNIIIYSSTFYPNVGGLENVMEGLADEWSVSNKIMVFTKTKNNNTDNKPYPIIRNTSLIALYKKVKNADVFVEANISLKTCLVGLLHKKKWVVIHHLPYNHQNTLSGKLKNQLTKICHNISVSNYVAATLKGKSIVINNFYNTNFRKIETIKRDKDFIFLGRLVSDKGADIAINAFAEIIKKEFNSTLTIVGDGPEKEALQQIVNKEKIEKNVFFEGVLTGEKLVEKLNEHKVMIIPSRWQEPFGLIALEGLACGCKLIAAKSGGLTEAAEEFGNYFPMGDKKKLVELMEQFLMQPQQFNVEEEKLKLHLFSKTRINIAQKYLNYFKEKLLE
ncbi:MAG: glycosyltransferase family 4 protein [Bacteroidetes bacterium]|nr:glycosyltransferase family 4 protein [Bacteroidota bacterium]MBS1649255.1 glycosyltransferase family 4 protein [Bacteroidota bacterium]